MKFLDFFSLRFWLSLFDVRLSLGGGGGGGGGKTEFEWNDQMKPYWTDLLSNASQTADQPYSNYTQATGRSKVAGVNGDQQEGMQYTRNMAQMMTSPVGVLNQTRDTLQNTLNGGYLDSNPYAQAQGNPWTGMNANVQQNPYGSQTNPWGGVQVTPGANNFNPQIDTGGRFSAAPTDAGTNAFQGMDNPYFRQQLQSGMDDITAAYQHGTAADTNRMFAQSGAFGGSAHAQAVQNNQTALAKQLGNFGNQALSQQYDRSAGMDESRLGRAFQGQQFDANLGNQAFENAAQRGMQGGMFGANMQNQNQEALLGRDLQAQQFNKQIGAQLTEDQYSRQNQNQEAFIGRDLQNQQLNKQLGLQSWEQGQDRGSQAYMGERGLMNSALSPAQNEQALAYQRIGGMMGIGDFGRGVDQQYRDEDYNNWFDANNYNKNQNAWMAGILSGAQGGLPPNQMTTAPGSTAANSLGAALAAYGLFRNT